MFATGVTMGLAKWIIDDNCLVSAIDNAHLIYNYVKVNFIDCA